MTDEAIKAALREAAKALQAAFQEWHGAAPSDYEALQFAAVANSAFLRALPDMARLEESNRYKSAIFISDTRARLAAAVARAAQEPTQTCGGNTQSAAQEGGR